MSLRDLYQEMIVDHGKQPRNFGKLENPNYSHAGHNPLCGDKLILYVNEKDGLVQDILFEGEGCAISMASASLMTEAVKGKTINEILNLFDRFHSLVTEKNIMNEDVDDMGKLSVFSGVVEFPIRVKCATLAWHTLKAALKNNSNPNPEAVTTE